jgi:hypothetical protein
MWKFIFLVAVTGLTGCSGDSARVQGRSPDLNIAPMSRDAERRHIQEEGHDFCERYPDDIACPSKGRR